MSPGLDQQVLERGGVKVHAGGARRHVARQRQPLGGRQPANLQRERDSHARMVVHAAAVRRKPDATGRHYVTRKPRDRLGAVRVELAFEAVERGHDDVAMMDVGADRLHRLDPQRVDPLDVLGRQVRRVRAERELLARGRRRNGSRTAWSAPARAASGPTPPPSGAPDPPARSPPTRRRRSRSPSGCTAVCATASKMLVAGSTSSFTPRPCRSAIATTLREQRLLVVGEQLVGVEIVRAAVGPAQQADRQHDDVALGRRVADHPVELRQRVVVAHRHQHRARPAVQRLDADFRLRRQLELIELAAVRPPSGAP